MSEETTETTETATPATEEASASLEPLAFGFAVLVNKDGGVYVERQASVFNVPVERDSTLLEVRRYCSEILMDLAAQSAAEYTVLRLAAGQSGESAAPVA